MTALLFAATGVALVVGWLLLIAGVLWCLYTATRPEADTDWDDADDDGRADEPTPLYDSVHLTMWEREFGERA